MGAPEISLQPASPHPPSPAPRADNRQVWELSCDPTQWSDDVTGAPQGEAGSGAGGVPGWEMGPSPYPRRLHPAGDDSTSHRMKGM